MSPVRRRLLPTKIRQETAAPVDAPLARQYHLKLHRLERRAELPEAASTHEPLAVELRKKTMRAACYVSDEGGGQIIIRDGMVLPYGKVDLRVGDLMVRWADVLFIERLEDDREWNELASVRGDIVQTSTVPLELLRLVLVCLIQTQAPKTWADALRNMYGYRSNQIRAARISAMCRRHAGAAVQMSEIR